VESAETQKNTGTSSVHFIYRLLPELAETGDFTVLQGCLELAEFTKGAMLLRVQNGIRYNLHLSNTGSGVLLSGTAEADILTDCTRCLEEARLKLTAEVEGYYILDPRDAEIADQDDSAELLDETGMVDLAAPIIAALIYELPFIVLCREDCAGLCPKCYINLNHEECTCAEEIDLDHPLAALRALFTEAELEAAAHGIVQEAAVGDGGEVGSESGAAFRDDSNNEDDSSAAVCDTSNDGDESNATIGDTVEGDNKPHELN
jgi:uncharacterized protein